MGTAHVLLHHALVPFLRIIRPDIHIRKVTAWDDSHVLALIESRLIPEDNLGSMSIVIDISFKPDTDV